MGRTFPPPPKPQRKTTCYNCGNPHKMERKQCEYCRTSKNEGDKYPHDFPIRDPERVRPDTTTYRHKITIALRNLNKSLNAANNSQKGGFDLVFALPANVELLTEENK